jgi:cell wall arabinan synthesis protein/EmbC-like arabinotransferase in arabinogalactan biosynthesis/arabinosyltransferase-like concanavalin domain-containing protein
VTDVSDAVADTVVVPRQQAQTAAPRPAGAPREWIQVWRRHIRVFAGIAALIAVVCGAALPFAPVAVNEPTVSWPQDPATPVSTLLNLTAYRPLQLEIRFSCAVARLAEASGGTVVSTARPDLTQPVGLRVISGNGRVQVRSGDATLLDEPIPATTCTYVIAGSATGRPVELPRSLGTEAPEVPASVAGPADARLTVARDGQQLASRTSERLPDVDMIATSLTAFPPSLAGQLTVRMRVDDEFVSSPSPMKTALIVMATVALLVVACASAGLDGTVFRVPVVRRLRPPRLVDLLVPAALLLWTIVAPATDDDGYYSAMAQNGRLIGEVGNYYQLYNQSFTPFTWFYRALGAWQGLVGLAPVAQRVPALVFGLLTWLLLRRFMAAATAARDLNRWMVTITEIVLAAAFLAWWVPFDMGVRPESVVAVCAAGAMVAVFTAARRRMLLYAFGAFALAGLGFTVHPTGFTALAPLLAGLPLVWSVVRVRGDPALSLVRGAVVVAGGVTALLAAFADGALRDYLRGETIFLAIQDQESWTTEIKRYTFLLSDVAMGNFAKRSAILVCIVALVWFAVLVVAARVRRVTVPAPLLFAGTAIALSFAALWFTPSKWTHHFGALAGVGSAFLALFLVMAIPLLRAVLHDAPLPIGVAVAVGCSAVMAIALAWRGPNLWPYAYLTGLWGSGVAPTVMGVPLGSVAVWLAVSAVTLGGFAVAGRVLHTHDVYLNLLRAVPAVVVASLLGTATYTVAMFATAAREGVPEASIWARSLADPTGAQCGAAGVIRVLDPGTARPLSRVDAAAAAPAPAGFVEGAGFAPGEPPVTRAQVWGSLVARDGRTAESTRGQLATAWYRLPGPQPDGAAVTVLGAGTLGDGNALTAIYGTPAGGGVTELGRQQLTDAARNPAWRTMILRPPAGADMVRLAAVDGTAFTHGWLAFSAPEIQRPITLSAYIPRAAPVAVNWQIAFDYPCLRQPRAVDGITEPAAYAVVWGDRSLSGLSDGIWTPDRGGLFGQIPRSQSVQQLATVDGTDPTVQVYAFGSPLARDAYTVTTTTRIQDGAVTESGSGPPGNY